MKKYAVMALCALLWAGMPSKGMAVQSADTLSLWVNGLCGMCKTRIENAALKARGVKEASWDAESRMLTLTVTPGKYKEDQLHYKVASAGHDTRQLLAPDPVYAALPMCCKYRDFESHDAAMGAESEGTDAATGAPTGITGFVGERDEEGKVLPLAGANIYWEGNQEGSTSDTEGMFFIEKPELVHMLVVSFVGYGADTIHLDEASEIEVVFSRATALEEVRITHTVKATAISFSSAYNVRNIHEKELTKAACCNLSESFETNPSVDATFTDAVTGTRKIEMLGLAGPYVQITRENMPDVRGMSALHGLTYIPGTWIEGIQLNMGAGSVVNGFESMTGQINVELRKPENSDRLFLNAYGNSDGALEANVLTSYPLGEHWDGSLLLHAHSRPLGLDHNRDGFLDHPMGPNLVALKRFKYSGDKGFESQIGIRGVYSSRHGGQVEFDPDRDPSGQSAWGSAMEVKRLEAWGKAGKVFPDRPYSSIGFQLSALYHEQDAFFGSTTYLAQQASLYANLIYQGILGNTNHQYRTGLSFQADRVQEELSFGNYQRTEWVPGAFLEYTFNHLDRFSLVAGIRGDYHNLYGAFLTPRLHLRYEPVDRTVFKASAGRGQKTASIFAENIGIFASSRNILVEGDGSGVPYGLDAEVSWSFGLSFAQGFQIGPREAVLSVDYFHTRFVNQIVVDLDHDPREVRFYNLNGTSRSNSLQLQADLEAVTRLDVRLAYRLNDVLNTYSGELLARPLTARHMAFINLAYATKDLWTFDLTWSWQGSKRIPDTSVNPEPYRRENASPSFFLVNLQVGKTLFDRLELYTGVENLLDFRQDDPIIASENPFGEYFDASLIWGPVFGRKFYAGLRFRIE